MKFRNGAPVVQLNKKNVQITTITIRGYFTCKVAEHLISPCHPLQITLCDWETTEILTEHVI